MGNATLDTGEWVGFEDSDKKAEILGIYSWYFLRSIRIDDILVRQGGSEGVLELKNEDGLNGFTYITGEHHDSRLDALRRLDYKKTAGFDLTFKFDDYENQISGFVWRKVE